MWLYWAATVVGIIIVMLLASKVPGNDMGEAIVGMGVLTLAASIGFVIVACAEDYERPKCVEVIKCCQSGGES